MSSTNAQPRPGAVSRSGDENQYSLYYYTYSVCGYCMLVDRKGLKWQRAGVLRRQDKVFLEYTCPDHGESSTLLCSRASFFEQVYHFRTPSEVLDVKSQKRPPSEPLDIEDIYTVFPSQSLASPPSPDRLPLIMELSLFREGKFIEDSVITDKVQELQGLYPSSHKFVLKLNGRAAVDMETFNRKCRLVVDLLPAHPLLVEVPYDRWPAVVAQEHSVLLHPETWPALQMYIRAGEEQSSLEYLRDIIPTLTAIDGVQAVISLVLDRPLPKLKDIMTFLSEKKGLVKAVIVSSERTPDEIVSGLKATSSPTLDPIPVLDVLSEAIGVTANDLMPVAAMQVLEPFIAMLGHGLLSIRPSPFCAFGSALINFRDLNNVPISRLINIKQLYDKLLPLQDQLNSAVIKEKSIGFLMARKLRKIIQSCAQPGVKLPDIIAYLHESKKAKITEEFVRDMQYIIVHNTMDLASVDIMRRCKCMITAQSTLAKNGLAAACTSCI